VNCIGVVVNGVGKQGSMAGYGYDHYKYADEYTTPYTTADHDAHADPEPAAAERSATTETTETRATTETTETRAPSDRGGKREAAPHALGALGARPVMNGAAEPSTNGHAGHDPHPAE
jgi:hypothetical protein